MRWSPAVRIAAIFCGAVLAANLHAQSAPNDEASRRNEIPSEAVEALRKPEKVILYSLEPMERPASAEQALYRYKILGQVELPRSQHAAAIGEFEKAVAGWDQRMAMCFDPRHAIRVTSKGATYDLLLCYACHQLYVYRDGTRIAGLGAHGSAKVLNAMFVAAGIPVSKSYNEDEEEARRKKARATYERWTGAMPASIRAVWDQSLRGLGIDLKVLREAAAGEFPDPRRRALALFGWYGAGAGPWSGFPSYESAAEDLLLEIPTDELVAAAQTVPLTLQQTEGAARLFGGWAFRQKRPEDLARLPAELKSKLLEHALKSNNDDNIQRARSAFALRQ